MLHLVRKHAAELRVDGDVDYDALEQSGHCLVEWLNVVNGHGRMMDAAPALKLETLIDEHVRLAILAGVKMYPKHSMVVCFFGFWQSDILCSSSTPSKRHEGERSRPKQSPMGWSSPAK